MPRKPHDHRTLPRSIILLESGAVYREIFILPESPQNKKNSWGDSLCLLWACCLYGERRSPPVIFLGASRRSGMRCLFCQVPWGAKNISRAAPANIFPPPRRRASPAGKKKGGVCSLHYVTFANPFINGSKGEGQRPPRGRAL